MDSRPLFIIFGASGDLSCRKLFPALYNLMRKGHLSDCALIGIGLGDTTMAALFERARVHMPCDNDHIWDRLLERSYYYQCDITDKSQYYGLSELAKRVEKQFALSGDRLVYCAVAAHFFSSITEYIVEHGIVRRQQPCDILAPAAHQSRSSWHRVIYEKPFGYDRQSASAINVTLEKNLDESQIYRIDHYLTKELVSNIILLRFTNIIFEPLWNAQFIDQVYIELSETALVGDRASYYDRYGALADVVQNHMMELLALVGMENPGSFLGDDIRSERAKLLSSVIVYDALFAQYDGYRAERGVGLLSQTETYTQLVLGIDNDRWRDVPFFLKTGKGLDTKKVAISIKFKAAWKDALLGGISCDSPWLTMSLDRHGEFSMNFCQKTTFGSDITDSYEILLREIMRGEQSASVRVDEIDYAWKIIEAIRARSRILHSYAIGSRGPLQAEDFEKKYDIRWCL